MEQKNDSYHSAAGRIPSLRPSFREAMCRAERQLDPRYFRKEEREDARELCMILAEVYMMAPDKPIRISGEWLDGYIVQEIFGQITVEHGHLVLDEFSKLTDEIKNPKAYLRTMLYNSVFSLGAHYHNEVNVDMYGTGELDMHEERKRK